MHTDWWLFSVTALLVIVGFFQFRTMQEHARIFKSQESTTRKQLRAYLMPYLGGAVFQDETHVFEPTPRILNTGETPAHSIDWTMGADVFPVPLPQGFIFPELDIPAGNNGMSLGKGQDINISKIVPRRVADAAVSGIKNSVDHGLYCWGIVIYRDIFGDKHTLRFAQLVTWSVDDKSVRASYPKQHNFSD